QPVAEPAEQDRAERAHAEAGAEGGEGEEQARGRIGRGEEELGDDGRERAVDEEIVPFEDGAERGGEDDQPVALRIDDEIVRCCRRQMILPLYGWNSRSARPFRRG